VGSGALLIYEGDCGFCNRCVRFISRRLPSRAQIKPWQRVDLDALGITRARARHEVLWVEPGGRVYGGAQAIAALLLDCGGLWAVLGAMLRVPPFRWLGHGLYRLVANNRTRLPDGGPACGMRPEPDDPARRN
jgi:predicted DCC family thiol-disulfide oxidoreductase YuxK